MNKLEIKQHSQTFDQAIHRIEDSDVKYCFVREPISLLGYDRWENCARVLDKAKTACQNSQVEFFDHFRDVTKMVAIGSGKNQNVPTPENIQKIIDTYQARGSVDKYAYLETRGEIQENDYNLNIPRYVDTFEEEEGIDLMAMRKERLGLQKKLKMEMAGCLEGLGYGS